MDSDVLQHIMMAEGLEPTTQSTRWDYSTGKFGFGYGVQLCRHESYRGHLEEMHSISFNDIKAFEKMSREQVAEEVSKVKRELLLKVHFYKYFQSFCAMPAQEQAISYKSFLNWIVQQTAEEKE